MAPLTPGVLPEEITQQELIDAWRSTVPEELTSEIEDDWRIFLFEMPAQVLATVDEGFVHELAGLYVTQAEAGVKALGRVIWATLGGNTLAKGATFLNERGVRFVTLADSVTGGAFDYALAEALLMGRQGNNALLAALTLEDGEWSGTAPDPLPSFLAFTYSGLIQPTAFQGGRDAQLESLGRERGIRRQDGESVEAYRDRVWTLQDNVTPAAIVRSVRRILRDLTGLTHPTVVLVEHYEGGIIGDVDPWDEEMGPETAKGNPPGYIMPQAFGDSRCWFTVYIDPLDETPEGLVLDVGPLDELPLDVWSSTAAEGYQRIYTHLQAIKAGGVGFYLCRRTDWPSDEWGPGPYSYYYGDYDYAGPPYGYPEEV